MASSSHSTKAPATQLIVNRVLVPIDDGSWRPYLTIDSPVRLDQEPKVTPRRAPELGEHTEQTLDQLGFVASPCR